MVFADSRLTSSPHCGTSLRSVDEIYLSTAPNRAILTQVDDYMESSQPGLNFSPVNRAEIVSQLHEFKFQLKPRMKFHPRAEQSCLKIELFASAKNLKSCLL